VIGLSWRLGRLHKAHAEKYLLFSWFIVLFHYLIVYLSSPSALHNIFHTPMARYILFVLKVPLDTNYEKESNCLAIQLGNDVS